MSSEQRHSDLDARPSPEALLELAAREQRGRLKIFLGAAPGVGKTYEMLHAAHARRREGVDVAVGVVETHGRAETEALVSGLEVVARRGVVHRGQTLDEMDLDAVLTRAPALVLVDELAHTNAPGSRHPKRYLDVDELLAAGIDVYTTLNIQHVESLNDVVAQITHIRVKETVPDRVLDAADDIEIVDLSPEDLIRRLREGKVYIPEQAERALQHFFAPGNLTALRELALRRTAERVDEQLLTHMRAHAIRGPWSAGERVLVCVSDHPSSPALVRHAKRVADRLHAPWTALAVETEAARRASAPARNRLTETLASAQRLGAQAVTLPARDIVGEILSYARANNVTQIIVGKSKRPRWFEILYGSVVHDLIRRATGIGVQVVPAEEEEDAPSEVIGRAVARLRAEAAGPEPFLVAGAGVGAALAVSYLLAPLVRIESVDLVFLTAVIAVAIRYGLYPSLLACIGSSLAYNFFFLPPLYTFTVTDPANVAALISFTAMAVVISNLAARVRGQAVAARERAETTDALYAFSRKLAGVVHMEDLLWAAVYQIASMLDLEVVLLLPEDDLLEVRAGYPPEDRLDEADHAAARWTWTSNRPAGRGADTLPGARRLFLPLHTSRGPVGVVGIHRERSGPMLTPEERRLLDALLDQTAMAIERIHMGRDLDEARMLAETERLRGALLTSLSHDLKTPLASIIGAATSLQQYDDLYDAAARRDLVATIQDEAERLTRFVLNLLDMTRLGSGALQLNTEMVEVGEIVGTALRRATRMLSQHKVEVDLSPELPMLRLDPVLLEQVLVNILDNAAKYAPEGSCITIQGSVADASVTLRIRDEGPGIPPQDLEKVFEKFYRVEGGDRRRAGTGLGLAVCRGFVEALGGTIHAGNREDRSGAVFTIELPVPDESEPDTGETVLELE